MIFFYACISVRMQAGAFAGVNESVNACKESTRVCYHIVRKDVDADVDVRACVSLRVRGFMCV